MTWSVVATFAGVIVAAGGAAWGIAREQSVMRQLERVSSVLSEMPAGTPASDDLRFVRDDLARRINRRYRAPKMHMENITGWWALLTGLGLLIAALVTGVASLTARSAEWDSNSGWLIGGLIALLALLIAVNIWRGGVTLAKRLGARQAWVDDVDERADKTASESPLL